MDFVECQALILGKFTQPAFGRVRKSVVVPPPPCSLPSLQRRGQVQVLVWGRYVLVVCMLRGGVDTMQKVRTSHSISNKPAVYRFILLRTLPTVGWRVKRSVWSAAVVCLIRVSIE